MPRRPLDYPSFIETQTPDWRRRGLYGDEVTPLGELGPPEMIEVEPIHFCNFRCIMCHVYFEAPLSRRRIDVAHLLKRLKSAGLGGRWLMVSSGYEGTAHPEFANLVNGASGLGMKIELTTNGSLLTPALVADIAGADFRYVTLSFDGSSKETFEYIREGANFERTVERIEHFRESLRRQGTFFNVNHTTMARNLDEIPETVRFWDDRDIDQIFFIGMRVRPAAGQDAKHATETVEGRTADVVRALEAAAEMVIAEKRRIAIASPYILKSDLARRHPGLVAHHVVRSAHPDSRIAVNPRSYYQNGAYPGMAVDCRSPFKFARIDYNGDVFLCQQFKIGNIADHDFNDIWHGERAEGFVFSPQ